jgi:hypothetical protein
LQRQDREQPPCEFRAQTASCYYKLGNSQFRRLPKYDSTTGASQDRLTAPRQYHKCRLKVRKIVDGSLSWRNLRAGRPCRPASTVTARVLNSRARPYRFTNGLRQFAAELSGQIAQSRGNNLWIAVWRSARSSQPGMAGFELLVAIGRGNSPLCVQISVPTGIDIELLDVDGDSDHFLFLWPICQIDIGRRQQTGKIGRQRSLEALIQSLGPLCVLDVSDFIRAVADRHRLSEKIRGHFHESNSHG